MPLQIEQFMCRSDNFGVLVHDADSGQTAVIDAPEEKPILDAIRRTGWKPTILLITHHHADHVEANLTLKQQFGLEIVGPEKEKAKIPGIDRTVREGDTVTLGTYPIEVIETPGHTKGHVSYYIPEAGLLFAADTLFALGCGRLLEDTPQAMHGSLSRLIMLPDETAVYCGHEYTAANAKFALSVDPDNARLQERAAEIARLRADDRATLPTTIGLEKATNPFVRWDDPAIRAHLGMEDASDAAVFAEVRKRKDNF